MHEITQILNAIDEEEDVHAAERLLPLVYEELRQLAAQKLAHLVGKEDEQRWASRGHFFAAAAEAMRRILVDAARRKQTLKRGGDRKHERLDDIAAPEPDENLISLDEALEKLAARDPLKAKLVELRYFAGLKGEQAAKVLGISPATVDRHWAYARAWLQAEVRGNSENR